METTITKVNPVEYELEIKAKDEELAPRVDQELRRQKSTVNMKGFRPGRVPVSLLRKMFGKAVSLEVAERYMLETFEGEVIKSDEYDVFGKPEATALEYEPGSDFRAVVRFGVRPSVDLKDLSGEKFMRLAPEVSDAEVEEEVSHIREQRAVQEDVDEPAGEDSIVVVDIQELDPETRTPIVGKRDEDVTFRLGDENLAGAIRDPLLGRKVGEEAVIEMTPEAEGGHESHPHYWRVEVKKVQKQVLPELNEEFIKEMTEGKFSSEEELREDIRRQLTQIWEQRSRQLLEQDIVDRVVELHPLDIPESAVELFLDSFEEELKQRNEGKLPDNFDRDRYRQSRREDAIKLARWSVIKEFFAEEHGIELQDEDYERHFEELASGSEFEADTYKTFYRQMPKLQDELDHRILSTKIVDRMVDLAEVEELEKDAYMERRKKVSEQDESAPPLQV